MWATQKANWFLWIPLMLLWLSLMLLPIFQGPVLWHKARVLLNLAPEVGRWGGGGNKGWFGSLIKLNLKSTTTFKNKEILDERQSELNVEKPALCILLHPFFKSFSFRGAWVAQSVEHLTSAQVMISGFEGSSPTSGSVLAAQSLEPPLHSMTPSLSAPPLLTHCLSLKNK